MAAIVRVRRFVRWPPAHPTRVAAILWLTFAVVVWNVVFDRILVIEGREYVHAAAVAANGSGPYVRANDWMRAAQKRALWIASAAGGGIVTVGFAAIAVANRRERVGDLQSEMKSKI